MELEGCWLEARRADDIVDTLNWLHSRLEIYRTDIRALVRIIEETSRLLNALHRQFSRRRTGENNVVCADLRLVLPSLQKTLMRMKGFVGNIDLFPSEMWQTMDEQLFHEGNMTLHERFELYNTYLRQIHKRLTEYVIFLLMPTESC